MQTHLALTGHAAVQSSPKQHSSILNMPRLHWGKASQRPNSGMPPSVQAESAHPFPDLFHAIFKVGQYRGLKTMDSFTGFESSSGEHIGKSRRTPKVSYNQREVKTLRVCLF